MFSECCVAAVPGLDDDGSSISRASLALLMGVSGGSVVRRMAATESGVVAVRGGLFM